MMKFSALSILMAAFVISCAPHEKNISKAEEEESNKPDSVVLENLWVRVTDGDKHFRPGSSKSFKTLVDNGASLPIRTWSGSAWNNDHASSRIDIATFDKAFPGTTIVATDLLSENGSSISKENIKAGYLAAINTKSEAYPNITEKMYDVITRKAEKDLEAGNLYSAWVDIYVPENTPKGIYSGKIKLESRDSLIADLNYELEVFDLTLTDPSEWKTFLDLWETPFASNRYYSGKTDEEFFAFTTPLRQDTNPFSLYYLHLDPKYQAGLESELELYHQAGGNTISVQIVEGPDNSRLPCATPSMVKWKYKTDGTWEWDYTDMDYFVELNLKHGINRQIDLFYHTGVGWGFVYYDENTGAVNNKLSAQPWDERYKVISHEFLQDLANHLEEKGWFDMAVLYMDERLYDVTLSLIEVAEGVSNSKGVKMKAGGAVNGKEVAPLYDRMYDVSIWENAKPSDFAQLCASRREKGLQTTLYTCGSGKMSTMNQPAEAAFAVYDALRNGADGVMRWALNKFDYDPLHGEIHTTCYPGDCYLIYPDEKDSPEMKAQSTPRFEKLCEAMRISEKLNLIKKNNPAYSDSVDEISYLKGGDAVKMAATMREKVRELSRTVQLSQ